ncbi:hypothetical protein EDC91_1045 [Shewanella fodinae]|uniref:Uncharacterized protein n=1 Tax=Shewanella fodinae TaxID=552357 RepID=A0A4R2FE61_9GAMM|nr:hypothetical protein EDC91_1045 [Shewanella fodinae]
MTDNPLNKLQAESVITRRHRRQLEQSIALLCKSNALLRKSIAEVCLLTAKREAKLDDK